MVILVSLNAQGLCSSDRREVAFQFFNRKKFDVMCLQETHWTSDLEMIIKRQWKAISTLLMGMLTREASLC